MANQGVAVSWSDGSAAVQLNRPERGNALDSATVEELIAVLQHATASQCRLMVLSGAGNSFCTGFDLDGLDGMSDADLLQRFVRVETLLQMIHHAPFPVLCLAHGRNFGAGVDIFCACSGRIADPDARFRMPGWRFGLALGTRRLAGRIGHARAQHVLGGAVEFSAADALAWGMAGALVPQTDWPAAQSEWIRQWSGLDGAARQQLLRILTPDTQAADMADLVASASRPGLKDRILSYGAQRRAAR